MAKKPQIAESNEEPEEITRVTARMMAAARTLVSLSQQGLADEASISVWAVRRFEKGDSTVGIGALDAMVLALANKGVRFSLTEKKVLIEITLSKARKIIPAEEFLESKES